MIYPQNFEQKTGFDKVRRLISDKCLSPLGQERVAEMEFSADYTTVIERLEQTDEFVRILHGDVEFPASFFFDVRYSLKRIRPEGTWLDEKELFDLKRSLQTINDIVRFFRPTEEEEIAYPALTALAGDILVFPQLIGKIDSILDKFGKVKDNASPTLAQIRKEITATMSGISRSLQSILRSAQSEGVVDKDVTPTMRDGRLMIPVAPAFKRKIKGIVHDESASGKTVFIEPEVVVEANNRVRELEGDERREIMKILTEFTNIVRPMVPDILQSYEFMADIDFIRAKALFAEQVKGIKPVVENIQQVDWARAVHPLLYLSLQKQDKQVIPLDITLSEEKRILIISGPNAGGKSVCLKTVGLLQYMMQCGLLIPLHESSRTGIFSRIFIDIGDEQSIENDLSTYSSHLTNMKYFVRNCDEKTIILIDEFGSGTEPQIGGAIAEALLDRFNRNRSFGVITTHYQNLKHFAEDTEGIVNGAMLYDRHLMQPLFKLSIGNPGSSFAVEIARKIGLPEDVIADASAKVGSDYIDMDKYLQDIVRDKRYWESKRQNIRQREKKLEDITSRYEKDLEEVNKQRKEIMREAKAEAQRILAEANAKIENTVREIKEAQAEKEQTKLARKALEEFKTSIESTGEEDDKIARKMAKLQERKERKKQKQNAPPTKQAFNRDVIEVGDNVRLKGQVSAGTVMELQGKQAVVAFGMIKSTVKLEQLEKVSKGQIKKEIQKSTFVSVGTTDHMHEKKLNFKQEIDVRGMRGDEALQAVTYFIDDAIQVGAGRVRILHGTGTGILRQLIRDYLHSVPGVEHYHDEHVQFGGAGITVVELD
ncbi:endonuclease MutS2 [Parabacteroides faecis]|uniref:endonuclease MutS2 n=1 Tax=Parabacteroides TaxID=375288 RepID=UPI000EFEFF71|nr:MULTISPECIES: endonuclease MutS2 [Parabacteroides]MBC8617429.1 endonuclease MutS2 [Parabacteroides faecis]RHR99685.1 endonuclease MutS2 [Parabacteroides sp. AF14-59]